MTAPISKMPEDFALAMATYAKQAVAEIEQLVQRMAQQAESMSTPAYGITITSRVEKVDKGARVVVTTKENTGGVGTVFGGQKAAAAAVSRRMDTIATGAGLDRHG